jgi:Holliday junction resolvase
MNVVLKNKPKQQSETAIRRAVKQYLEAMGFFVITNQQGLGSYRGLSDLTALKDGTALWIEIKTSSKDSKQSEYQAFFEERLKNSGGIYLLIRSVEEMEQALIGLGFELKGQIKMFGGIV